MSVEAEPRFIVLEGIDGSGKGTQSRLLKSWLQKKGCKVFLTEEPTATKLGSIIKKIIKNKKATLAPETQALLFTADRFEHAKKIKQKLDKGHVVVCDRYYFSTLAYQGAGGASESWILKLNEFLIKPDLTLVLDIKPEIGLQRIKNRNSTSYFEKLNFLREVRNRYKKICGSFENAVEIDASKSIEQVHKNIISELMKRGVK